MQSAPLVDANQFPMSLVVASASEMTYIVSSGALNSTHYYYSGRSYPRSSTRGDLAVPRTKTSTQRTMQVCSVGANKLELTTTVVP